MKKFSEVYGNANSVTLNVTNNCNLNCVYCFEKEKNPAMMPPEVAIDAIDKMYNTLEGREQFTIRYLLISLEESLFLTGRQSKQ